MFEPRSLKPCTGLQAEEIFSVNIDIYIFSILAVATVVLFLCYFQKLHLLVIKKLWNNFYCIVLLLIWAQKASQILKPYFKLEGSRTISPEENFPQTVKLTQTPTGGNFPWRQLSGYQTEDINIFVPHDKKNSSRKILDTP